MAMNRLDKTGPGFQVPAWTTASYQSDGTPAMDGPSYSSRCCHEDFVHLPAPVSLISMGIAGLLLCPTFSHAALFNININKININSYYTGGGGGYGGIGGYGGVGGIGGVGGVGGIGGITSPLTSLPYGFNLGGLPGMNPWLFPNQANLYPGLYGPAFGQGIPGFGSPGYYGGGGGVGGYGGYGSSYPTPYSPYTTPYSPYTTPYSPYTTPYSPYTTPYSPVGYPGVATPYTSPYTTPYSGGAYPYY